MHKNVRNYFLRLAVVIALVSNITTANNVKTSPKPKKEGIEAVVDGVGEGLKAYLDDGWKYGAVDDYINWNTVSEGDLNTIIYGITHYPPDYVFDIARTFEAAFGKVPEEAMRRAKAEKKAESANAQVIQAAELGTKSNGPLETLGNAAGGVCEFVHDSFRFVWHYASVSLEGMAEQLTKRPSETASHGFWTWFWVYQCSTHGSSNGNGAGGGGNGAGGGGDLIQ